MEPDWARDKQPQCQPHASERVLRFHRQAVGRRPRGLYPHLDEAPGACVQCGFQPRRQVPGKWLFRQVCAHLEHTDRCSSPQLQGNRWNLRGLLECSGRQSWSQCIRWFSLCIRPSKIALLVGSHGPTMNVYIAKRLPRPRTAVAPEPWPVHYSQLWEVDTYSVYKQSRTLKMTEFCHSLWILFTKCWNLICCAPKIAFRSFGFESRREKEVHVTKADHSCTRVRILKTAVSLPSTGRHHELRSFSLRQWAACMYRENGLSSQQ